MLTTKKENAIPLLTSAVIFEKVPTDRSTAAEKMTSSAHSCSLSPSLSLLSVQIHTLKGHFEVLHTPLTYNMSQQKAYS